jgi:hyperosmotically inducible periplasmic protein
MTRTEELKQKAEDRAKRVATRARRLGRVAGRRAEGAGEGVAGRAREARRRVGYWIAGEEPQKGSGLKMVAAGAAGAAAAFYLDPVSGKRRRQVTRDWLAARARKVGRRVGRTGRVGNEAYGTWQSARYAGQQTLPENDAVLAHKVESEALRSSPGLSVNAEDGVVVLRGAVGRPDEIDQIEMRVRAVTGVRGVRNLLRLEETPAPTTR